MIQYIYIVKCPNCEDEHFDFFDEAKAFALGCITKNPIIDQVEVHRNDFGECTDSYDLGTIWSYEDILSTEEEPAESVFTPEDFNSFSDEDFDIVTTPDRNSIEEAIEEENFDRKVFYDFCDKRGNYLNFEDRIDAITTDEEAIQFAEANPEICSVEKSTMDSDDNMKSLEQIWERPSEQWYVSTYQGDAAFEPAEGGYYYETAEYSGSEKFETKEAAQKYLASLPGTFDEEFGGYTWDIVRQTPDEIVVKFSKYIGDGVTYRVEREPGIHASGRKIYESVDSMDKLKGLVSIQKKCDNLADIRLRRTPKGNWHITDKGKDVMTVSGNKFSEEDIDNFRADGILEESFEGEANVDFRSMVEALEENEDTVECVCCYELFPKTECTYNEELGGYLCPDCEEEAVKCTWCDEVFPNSECRYEVDLGWLCSRCELAIKSRGETLTFKENNYWDFLDEAKENKQELPKQQDESEDIPLQESTDRVKQILSSRLSTDGKSFIAARPPKGFSFVSCTAGMNPSGEVMFNGVKYAFRVENGDVRVMTSASAGDNWSETLFKESLGQEDYVELEYDDIEVTYFYNQRDADDWDESTDIIDYTYKADKDRVLEAIADFLESRPTKYYKQANCDEMSDDEYQAFLDKYLEDSFDDLVEIYYNDLLKYFRDDAEEAAQNKAYETDYPALLAAEKADRDYDAWKDSQFDESVDMTELGDCPECAKRSFDLTEGYCHSCGLGYKGKNNKTK